MDESKVIVEIGTNLRDAIKDVSDKAYKQGDDVALAVKRAFNLDLTRALVEKMGGEVTIQRLKNKREA